jgi:antitoxin HigA-1
MSGKTYKVLLGQLAPAERKRVKRRGEQLIAEEKTRRGVRKKVVRRVRPDSEIDTSDIPPLTEDFFRRAVRNPFFRRAGRQQLKLTHPGRILRDEFMKPVGLSARALAKALYVPVAKVKPILESRSAISAEMAVLLSVYFGTSDRYWIDLQGHYDLQLARQRIRAHAAQIVPHPHDERGALRRLGS